MVDVCLVVEGSYPHVTGGVSAWVDGLLRAMPDVTFAVAHVRPAGSPERPPAYTPPGNAHVVYVDLDPDQAQPHAGAQDGLPVARTYHAACTGAAAELARRAALERGARFGLTEHGIAWREARWGISGCQQGGQWGWVDGCQQGGQWGYFISGCQQGGQWGQARPQTLAERRWRAGEVAEMARAAYADASIVTSVCSANARLQIEAGAPRERVTVVPNPVEPGAQRVAGGEGFLVGFVGRIVAIKDVAMFLRACGLVAEVRSDASFVVVGPLHYEPRYAEHCVRLATELGIGNRVTFTGEADPRPWYARMDVLGLTSLSEAQPLVALEAMAAGVPIVATDVGGCREAIGGAGLLTRPRAPRATADAILRLAHDSALRARMGAVGRQLTVARHDPTRVYGAYREMYERLAA
jgi:glycosyltransferase involved in cell wall biosynthesis